MFRAAALCRTDEDAARFEREAGQTQVGREFVAGSVWPDMRDQLIAQARAGSWEVRAAGVQDFAAAELLLSEAALSSDGRQFLLSVAWIERVSALWSSVVTVPV